MTWEKGYEIYEKTGREHGKDLDDWHNCSGELKGHLFLLFTLNPYLKFYRLNYDKTI